MVEAKIAVEQGFLVIRVPLKTAVKDREVSSSGKSLMLCSISDRLETQEAGLIRVGLNVYQKNPAYAAEGNGGTVHTAGREAGTR